MENEDLKKPYSKITIQTFDDQKERSRKDLARIFQYDPGKIAELQAEGAGIFFVPNPQINLSSRGIENTAELKFISMDVDFSKESQGLSSESVKLGKQELLKKLLSLEIQPNSIIETKNGYQPIWELASPVLLDSVEARKQANDLYQKLVKGVAVKTGLKSEGDNLCRVLRQPGTLHLKNPKDSFEIKIIPVNNKKPTLEEFKQAYPPFEKPSLAKVESIKNQAQDSAIKTILQYPVREVLEKISGTDAVNREEYDFQQNGNGTVQILVNGESTDQWIDLSQNTIGGSGTGRGNPTIIQWVQWYGINLRGEDQKTAKRKALEFLKKALNIPADNQQKSNENSESEDRQSNTQAIQVLEMVSESSAQLFHDQLNEGYMAPYGNGKVILKIKSGKIKSWLISFYWKKTKSMINPTVLQTVLQLLEAQACFEGPRYPLHVRIAKYEDSIWYDLGDGRAVKINSYNWEVVDEPPILFRRFTHQQIQVEPRSGGNLKEILNFLNLESDKDVDKLSNDQLLTLCWLVFGLIFDLPHPAPVLNGGQGSKKTTFLKVLKKLLDPSSVEVHRPPKTEAEFIQTASHHWLLVLDNMTTIPEWLSDLMCSIITGSGFSKRELFTNDDDTIYSFKHLIGVNGINLVVERADLLERSLILTLKRVKNFKTENAFWLEFEKKRAYILGGLFDILVKTLRIIKDTTEPEGEFRMADFVYWGSAIAQALGYKAEDFIKAYETNINQQNEEALDASPVGTAIIHFMEESGNRWAGSPTTLLIALENIAVKHRIDEKNKNWPKDPRWLWRRINEVIPNLEEEGIKAERNKEDKRLIILTKIAKNDVNDVVDVREFDEPLF